MAGRKGSYTLPVQKIALQVRTKESYSWSDQRQFYWPTQSIVTPCRYKKKRLGTFSKKTSFWFQSIPSRLLQIRVRSHKVILRRNEKQKIKKNWCTRVCISIKQVGFKFCNLKLTLNFELDPRFYKTYNTISTFIYLVSWRVM